jgi:hypothetical protein
MSLQIDYEIDTSSLAYLERLLNITKGDCLIHTYNGFFSNASPFYVESYGQYFYVFLRGKECIKFSYNWFDCGSTGDFYKIKIENLGNDTKYAQGAEFHKENRCWFYFPVDIQSIEVYGRQMQVEVNTEDKAFLQRSIAALADEDRFELKTDFQIAFFDKNDIAFLIDFNHSVFAFEVASRSEIERRLDYRFDDDSSKLIKKVILEAS